MGYNFSVVGLRGSKTSGGIFTTNYVLKLFSNDGSPENTTGAALFGGVGVSQFIVNTQSVSSQQVQGGGVLSVPLGEKFSLQPYAFYTQVFLDRFTASNTSYGADLKYYPNPANRTSYISLGTLLNQIEETENESTDYSSYTLTYTKEFQAGQLIDEDYDISTGEGPPGQTPMDPGTEDLSSSTPGTQHTRKTSESKSEHPLADLVNPKVYPRHNWGYGIGYYSGSVLEKISFEAGKNPIFGYQLHMGMDFSEYVGAELGYMRGYRNEYTKNSGTVTLPDGSTCQGDAVMEHEENIGINSLRTILRAGLPVGESFRVEGYMGQVAWNLDWNYSVFGHVDCSARSGGASGSESYGDRDMTFGLRAFYSDFLRLNYGIQNSDFSSDVRVDDTYSTMRTISLDLNVPF
ncbi:MAG: hypothetical protein ABEK50_04910 [bacterium]